MSDTEVNVNKHKDKNKKSAKEAEVSCWNCFTVENNDEKPEPIPLPKVREEHREKLKVYSFLASEISKPKAVSLKQKVSEHYSIGKKIDEKISSNQVQLNKEYNLTDKLNIYSDNILQESTKHESKNISNIHYFPLNTEKLSNTDNSGNEINSREDYINKTEEIKSIENNTSINNIQEICNNNNLNSQNIQAEIKYDTNLTTFDNNTTNNNATKNVFYSVNMLDNTSMALSNDKNIETPFYILPENDDIDKRKHNLDDLSAFVECSDSCLNKTLEKITSLDVSVNEFESNRNKLMQLPELEIKKSDIFEHASSNTVEILPDPKSIKYCDPTEGATHVEKKEYDPSSHILENEHKIDETLLVKMSKLSIESPIGCEEQESKIDPLPTKQKKPSREDKQLNFSSEKEAIGTIIPKRFEMTDYSKNVEKSKTMFENVIEMKKNANIPTAAVLSSSEGKLYTSPVQTRQSGHLSSLETPKATTIFKTREITRVTPPVVTKVIERKSIEKVTSQKINSYKNIDRIKNENNDDSVVPSDKFNPHIQVEGSILKSPSEKSLNTSNTSLKNDSSTRVPILQNHINSKYSPVSILRNKTKESSPQTSSNDTSNKLSDTPLTCSSIKSCIKQENIHPPVKVPVKTYPQTSTPNVVVRKISSGNHSSGSDSTRASLEIKDITPSVDKTDNTSSNGSESGYAGSSATVQELLVDEVTSKNVDKNSEETDKIENLESHHAPARLKNFSSSSSSLNVLKRKPLQSSSISLYSNSLKSPMKSLRWSTLSVAPRSISFEDEVYMSEALSSGHATLPRRSNSPLPNERDMDRDRFPINRSGLQARSESMASVYSGAGEGLRGSVTVRGEVQFSLLYNYRLGALEVGVKRCRDLAPVDVKRNRSDPYVKVYLLPDKSKTGKRKTKVKKNTLSPVFEETLSFAQPLGALAARTLWLSVWHADMFGRNDFLGEVALPLADVVFDDPAPTWHKLHERTEQFDEQQGSRGDLIIGLKFELQDAARGKGTLHVLVKEAKNLVATKPSGLADVFCKSYLLPERGRLAKQKTGVCRRTLAPRWEASFAYRGVRVRELAARALELSLWDRDRLASNDFMGAVRLSLGTGTYMGANVNWMDSVGKEVTLWETMMQRPNFWVEGSLPLRPHLNN